MKRFFTLFNLFIFLGYSAFTQVTPTVVADGFTNSPIGIEIDAQGKIWIGEMGTGNDDGAITIINEDGSKDVFMSGLPSAVNPFNGELAGPYRTYQRPNGKVLVMVGESDHPLAESILVVDKNDFTPGSPLTLADVEETIDVGTFIHDQGFMQSNPYNITWDADGNMYIADSGANSIVKRDQGSGNLSIVTTFPPFPNPLPFGPPMVDPVPTKVLAKPDGTFYVCQLTGFPFIEGAANIYNMDAAGNVTVHDSLYTCLTDMSFDPSDGNLCVMQFGVFGPVDSTLNFILGTAAVLKLIPDGSVDTLANGIGGLASSFTFDADGNVYVTDMVFGQVLKYQLSTSAEEPKINPVRTNVFPNPFSEYVQFELALKQSAEVQLDIFDMSGKIMLSTNGFYNSGIQSLSWDGNDIGKNKAPNGMYLYRLTIEDQLYSGLINLSK